MTNIIRIKAVDDWTLDVLSAPYGGPENGRDRQGEYFSPHTNFYLDKAPLPPVAYYHGYTPDGKPDGDPEIIGQTVKVWTDEKGVWHRVVLDRASEFAKRVWDAAKQGTARASTAVAGHFWRVLRSGEITHWLIGELSLFDAEGKRQPANQYAVVRPAVKRLFQEAGFDLESQGDATGGEQEQASDLSENDKQLSSNGGTAMDPEVITLEGVQAAAAQAAAAAVAEERKRATDEADAAKANAEAESERTENAVKAAREEWEADAAKNNRLPSGGAPAVAKFGNIWKYDNLDEGALSVMIGVLQADGKTVSENALKALAIRATQEENARSMHRVRAAMHAAEMPVKANELNQSTLASYGDEWVGVAYSTSLWEAARQEARIAAMLPSIEVPQGSESITIPIESTPPTFYKVAQASAQDSSTLGKATYTHTSSQQGTGQQSLTVGKMGARTLYTGELEEDSLINWAAELQRALVHHASRRLDSLVIDGDTETGATTNINDIGGTPAGTEYYLVADGFRKLALVTNTANSRSAGTLTVEDYLETIKLMGLGGQNAADRSKVAFIIDMYTHWKSLELTEIRTRDVFSAPTIENGQLTGLWGYPIYASADMHWFNADATYGLKANSAGKVDVDTAGNNTYGAILAVRWDQWRLGWKRRMKFETQRIPQADATDIVLNMRVGLVYRDTDAAAISYGVTV